jgi:hypothetical protein
MGGKIKGPMNFSLAFIIVMVYETGAIILYSEVYKEVYKKDEG